MEGLSQPCREIIQREGNPGDYGPLAHKSSGGHAAEEHHQHS